MGAAYLKAPEIEVYQQCRKIPYETRHMAARLMKSFGQPNTNVQRGEGIMNVYRCPVCRGWHIGHWKA
jgi:hypothetical protein